MARQKFKSTETETYAHPFLRTVSNLFLLEAYADAVKRSDTITDLSSKYHITSNWL